MCAASSERGFCTTAGLPYTWRDKCDQGISVPLPAVGQLKHLALDHVLELRVLLVKASQLLPCCQIQPLQQKAVPAAMRTVGIGERQISAVVTTAI